MGRSHILRPPLPHTLWSDPDRVSPPHSYNALTGCEWTVVNRSEEPFRGTVINVDDVAGTRYADVFSGRGLAARDGRVRLDADLPPWGIAGFVAAPERAWVPIEPVGDPAPTAPAGTTEGGETKA